MDGLDPPLLSKVLFYGFNVGIEFVGILRSTVLNTLLELLCLGTGVFSVLASASSSIKTGFDFTGYAELFGFGLDFCLTSSTPNNPCFVFSICAIA